MSLASMTVSGLLAAVGIALRQKEERRVKTSEEMTLRRSSSPPAMRVECLALALPKV